MMKLKRYTTITKRIYLRANFYSTPESEYCYIPILKNANTWGKHYFSKVAGFAPTDMYENKRFIIFLRHPLKRWVSAVAQWMEQNYGNPIPPPPYNLQIDGWLRKAIFSAIKMDDHGSTQFSFLEGLDLHNAIYFNVDHPKFEEHLQTFIYKNIRGRFLKDTNLPKMQTAATSPFKRYIQTHLENILSENPQYKKEIYNYYHADGDLYINSIYYPGYKISNYPDLITKFNLGLD